jgi:hypothetical protein
LPETFNAAVNGGTGIYRNARGVITFHDITDTRSTLTFDLIP